MRTLTDHQVNLIAAEMETMLLAPVAVPVTRVGSKVMPTGRPLRAEPVYAPAPAGPAQIVGAPAAQGDVLFLPSDRPLPHWTQPITGTVELVVEGNGHVLVPSGTVRYVVINGGIHGSRHLVGLLEVAPGGTCRVEQPRGGTDRHQPLTLGPGRWEIRRQTHEVAPGRRTYTLD